MTTKTPVLEGGQPQTKTIPIVPTPWPVGANGKAGAYQVEPGRTHPLGATADAKGVNFAIFSEYATSVELLLFNEHDDPQPVQVIRLNPAAHKTFHIWHVYVRGLKAGMHYAFRVDGPRNVHEGHRFDPEKVLI